MTTTLREQIPEMKPSAATRLGTTPSYSFALGAVHDAYRDGYHAALTAIREAPITEADVEAVATEAMLSVSEARAAIIADRARLGREG